jgi:hypothetical protein
VDDNPAQAYTRLKSVVDHKTIDTWEGGSSWYEEVVNVVLSGDCVVLDIIY